MPKWLNDTLVFTVLAAVAIFIIVLALGGCSVDGAIESALNRGVNCKAQITMPTGSVLENTATIRDGSWVLGAPMPAVRGDETVEVKVKIYQCKAAP